jgi:hypothetical protein
MGFQAYCLTFCFFTKPKTVISVEFVVLLGGGKSKIVGTFSAAQGWVPSNFFKNSFAEWFAALHPAFGFHFLVVLFF